jgi:superfamily II DNA or RNA helicase
MCFVWLKAMTTPEIQGAKKSKTTFLRARYSIIKTPERKKSSKNEEKSLKHVSSAAKKTLWKKSCNIFSVHCTQERMIARKLSSSLALSLSQLFIRKISF